ncbi:dihydrodipicolinate synthase family protein [Cupriavidus oxalaticus]|nr:dihydrodipicolinate synthase family protein [Cupriavidus oxalaticus]WQD85751.1 dihydrodipicolinate synthase family protein [Cupriavidus oxalaticus]
MPLNWPAIWLVPPPYYLRPSDEGLMWHFGEVARATVRPLMLYDVPKRTGCSMSPALIRSLLAHPQIVAVKECDSGNLRAFFNIRMSLRSAARMRPCWITC